MKGNNLMTILNILFHEIAQLSYMGSLIVVCILLSKKIIKDKFGVKFQYAIWFILIIRLLLPITLSSNISVYNYVPTYESTMKYIPVASPNINKGNNSNASKEITSISQENTKHTSRDITTYARKAMQFIWISGVFIIGSMIFISNTLFLKRIKKCSHIKDQNVLTILNDCKSLMKLSKNIYLVKTNVVKTPCVLNFLKPIILIPENCLEECNLIHLKYVLLHELAHVKRKDIFINYIVSLLCILYWFNPLIWYGFYKMREDREICCDSLALSVLEEEEVISYGFTIINIAEISLRAPCLPAMAGIINKKSNIKRRIKMIKIFKKNSYRFSAIALVALLLVSVPFLTGATKTRASSTEETPTLPIVDNIDYPFVDDEDAIGKWETVDFVKEIEDFQVNVQSWGEELYLKSIKLLPNGQMPQPIAIGVTSDETTPVEWLTWTKGYIFHHGDKTAGAYIIKEIDGSNYMFWEWKSGDYTQRGMKPYYYVLKQVK